MAITHSDGELVTAALVGGPEAFDELIARHQEQVFRIALGRLRDPDAAQDAVQDTFVKAYLNLSSLHQPSAFGSWVGQIATGTALDARRRTKHHLPLDDASAAGETSTPPRASKSGRPAPPFAPCPAPLASWSSSITSTATPTRRSAPCWALRPVP